MPNAIDDRSGVQDLVARPSVRFGHFTFDPTDQRVWKDGCIPVHLPPKAIDLLDFLVSRAGTLVTKQELLDGLWPDACVSDAVLKVAIRELRRALGDRARTPTWIETVHRRGYRFIGDVHFLAGSSTESGTPRIPCGQLTYNIVGREKPLETLFEQLASAERGERRTVFLTGEPGVGKTAVIDLFTKGLRADKILIAYGHCRESYGKGEAYLPILEAVTGICKGDGSKQIVEVFRRHAPTWLLQMPGVLDDLDRHEVEKATRHAGRERMLREIADGFEELSRERPVVLVLEDLHWSDPSTIDVLSTLAKRPTPARLLIVGSYRPVDVSRTDHPVRPLKQDLLAKFHGLEISLRPLGLKHVALFLKKRLGAGLPEALSNLMYERSGGNPLFLTSIVEGLLKQACIERFGDRVELRRPLEEIARLFPDELKEVLDRQVERLEPASLRLLECASVVGRDFSAETLAVILGQSTTLVEEALDQLHRREELVHNTGLEATSSGGTTGRYAFDHVLHQHALYERLGDVRRVDLHGRAGDALASSGAGPAQLANHYHAGRRPKEAAIWWQRAGDVALERVADIEALGHYEQALSLVLDAEDEAEREASELTLLTAIGPILGRIYGYGSPRIEEVYARARVLANRAEASADLILVLRGAFRFNTSRARHGEARRIAEQLHAMLESSPMPLMQSLGLLYCGIASFYLGELRKAREELERAIEIARGAAPGSQMGHLVDSRACAWVALVHFLMGDPAKAVVRSNQAIELMLESQDVFGESMAFSSASMLHRWRGDVQASRECAARVLAIADESGLEQWQPIAEWGMGWAQAQTGEAAVGLARMRGALHRYVENEGENKGESDTSRTESLAYQAMICGCIGDHSQGLSLIDDALELTEQGGERYCEAELYRVRGELLKAAATPDCDSAHREAEDCVRHSIEIAQSQGARAWELRSRVTLCGLFEESVADVEVERARLAELCDQFGEGEDTADLEAARKFLEKRPAPAAT